MSTAGLVSARNDHHHRSPGASGCLFVVAAPSGGGKTSLVDALLEREPGIRLSVSYTTRPPRPARSDGVDYHFVDVPTFLALKERGEFLEHAFVHGNWYATSATWLQAQVSAGQDVLLEIDWQGAAQVRRLMPDSRRTSSSCRPRSRRWRSASTKRGQDPPDVIARAARRLRARRCATAASSIMLLLIRTLHVPSTTCPPSSAPRA